MVIANKAEQEDLVEIKTRLHQELPKTTQIFVIPQIKTLSQPTVKEIVKATGGTVLFGARHLNNVAGSFGVGAMQLHNYLNHLRAQSVVVTPGDRSDIILGALQAHISDKYPNVSELF